MPAMVLSLGSINADFQIRIARRPERSETLPGREFMRLGGGKAANVAFLARRLGLEARLFARVGDDDLAEQALAPLRASGVDLSHVGAVAGHATGVAFITVPPDGKKGIVLAANANDVWSAEEEARIAEAVRGAEADSVLVADCEIPASLVETALKAARQCGVRVLLDPSPADRVGTNILEHSDVLLPNAAEAKSLTGVEVEGVDSAWRAGRKLLEGGPSAVSVKLPDGGCVLVERDRAAHIEGRKVDVIDTTGAGDAFAGAMAVALAERKELSDAAMFATAAALIAVTGYGSQPAYPDRRRLEPVLAGLRPPRILKPG